MNNEQPSTSVECDITGNTANRSEPMLSSDIIEKKTCAKCKLDLPLEMFSIRNRNNSTLNCYCKLCQPVIAHNWRINNLGKVKCREKLYRRDNKDKIQRQQKEYMTRWIARLNSRFGRWKKSAHRRGISFDLTLVQLETMPLLCHYTGNVLTLESNRRNTVSLDRLDSSQGYTITNVVYCCSFVNLMKHELSYSDFVNSCKAIVGHYEKCHKS
jgi:hypothetical protein